MEKNVLFYLFALILIVTVVQAKICWKHCSGQFRKQSKGWFTYQKLIYLLIFLIYNKLYLHTHKIHKNTEDDPKLIRSFNIDGCRRRKRVSVSGERGFMNFRCDGSNPPPCTIKRGDTVYLDVDFAPGEFPIFFS